MTGPETPALDKKIERTVHVQGIATHIFEAGDTTNPPLLYLHGSYLGNLWLDYHKALAQHFHIFVPDTPGYGLTERPDWMRDMSDYILYLRDLLNVLGLQTTHIVGHSLGGWMAAEIAVWYPERVNKLVLSNAAGLRVKGSPIADLFAMSREEIIAISFDDLQAAQPLIPAVASVDDHIQYYKEQITLATLTWNPSYDPKLQRRLAQLTCPTVVVWGANERVIPPIYGTVLQETIPNAQLAMLAGTGHMPMFEKCEEWASVITQFLQENV